MSTLIIFPDSNIFAHFLPIENWNWVGITDKQIQIGISTSIISEMDKIKYTANSNRVKTRVREFVKKVQLSESKIFAGVPFFIHRFYWDDDFLSKFNLDKDNNDEEDKPRFFIPAIVHNSRKYDTHLILKNLGKEFIEEKNNNIDAVAINSEQFISLTIGNFRILDSCQFLPGSLDSLVESMKKDGLESLRTQEGTFPKTKNSI